MKTKKSPKDKFKTTMRIIKYCNCGNYKSKSIKGIIDTRCKNCGGLQPMRLIN